MTTRVGSDVQLFVGSADVSEHVLSIDGAELARVVPEADFHLPVGVTRFKNVTIEGQWDGAHLFVDDVIRQIDFQSDTLRFLGGDWYRETIQTAGVPRLTEGGISLSLVGPVVRIPAAWWRRAGFRVLSLLRRATLQLSPDK